MVYFWEKDSTSLPVNFEQCIFLFTGKVILVILWQFIGITVLNGLLSHWIIHWTNSIKQMIH